MTSLTGIRPRLRARLPQPAQTRLDRLGVRRPVHDRLRAGLPRAGRCTRSTSACSATSSSAATPSSGSTTTSERSATRSSGRRSAGSSCSCVVQVPIMLGTRAGRRPRDRQRAAHVRRRSSASSIFLPVRGAGRRRGPDVGLHVRRTVRPRRQHQRLLRRSILTPLAPRAGCSPRSATSSRGSSSATTC